jgi:hypothetical protein
MRVIYLILMGFLGIAMVAFVGMIIGFGYFSYKEKEEKAAHAFFWSENLGQIRIAEAIQKDLQDEFPEGSSLEELVAKMKQNKAKCLVDKVMPSDKAHAKPYNVIYCSYEPEIYFLTTKKTLVSIYHTNDSIDNIAVMQKDVGLEL